MAYRLRRDTSVGRSNGTIEVLLARTRLSDIDAEAKAQLAPEHFEDDSGATDLPQEWRTDPATLEHDRRQAENTEDEARHRAEWKARQQEAPRVQPQDGEG